MSGVVDHLEVVFFRDFSDLIDITRMAVDMNRHDSRGLRRNCGLDLCWVKVQRVRVNIGKYRLDSIPKKECAVATKEYGEVMTSPVIRSACRAVTSAIVPLVKRARCLTPR